MGKGEIVHHESNFSFSHSVFKRFVLQTCKNQGVFGKGLKRDMFGEHDPSTTAHVLYKGYKDQIAWIQRGVNRAADDREEDGKMILILCSVC